MVVEGDVNGLEGPSAAVVRDAGNHPVVGGRMIEGRLFRSPALVDLAPLVERSIGLVVDLRTSHERALTPDPSAYAEVVEFPLQPVVIRSGALEMVDSDRAFEGSSELATLLDLGPRAVGLALSLKTDRMVAAYTRLLLDQWQVVASAIEAVAEWVESPCLVWCAQGQDRTGILVALIQRLVGVDRGRILSDYAYANRWIAPPKTLDRVQASQFVELVGVAVGAVDRLLDDDRWSTPDRVAAHLGLAKSTVEQLRALLVEPVS